MWCNHRVRDENLHACNALRVGVLCGRDAEGYRRRMGGRCLLKIVLHPRDGVFGGHRRFAGLFEAIDGHAR